LPPVLLVCRQAPVAVHLLPQCPCRGVTIVACSGERERPLGADYSRRFEHRVSRSRRLGARFLQMLCHVAEHRGQISQPDVPPPPGHYCLAARAAERGELRASRRARSLRLSM